MGGSSKSEKFDPAMNNITPVTPPWLVGAQPLVLPQAAPGQLEALAAQLAQGGYGSAKTNRAWMDQFYEPVHTLKLGAPPPIPAAPQPTVKPRNDPNRLVLVDGRWVPATRVRYYERHDR